MGELRVLLSAYACEPGRGSEPGLGWGWVNAQADACALTVVTRANNRAAIEAAVGRGEVSQSVRWRYLDLPRVAQAAKKMPLGIHGYYALWQRELARHAPDIVTADGIDVAHHVTFMSPQYSGIESLGCPSVLGPVGGFQRVPDGFQKVLGADAASAIRSGRNAALTRSRSWRRFIQRVGHVFAANIDTMETVSSYRSGPTELLQIPVTHDVETWPESKGSHPDPYFVWSGIHVRWKGLELGLRSFAELRRRKVASGATLRITGQGPATRRFMKLAGDLGLGDAVRFEGMLPRDKYLRLLAGARGYLFTSLRDTTGVALLEAMALGTPCVVLATGGPAAIATDDTCVLVHPTSIPATIQGFAHGMERLLNDGAWAAQLGRAAAERTQAEFSWSAVAGRAREVYRGLVE